MLVSFCSYFSVLNVQLYYKDYYYSLEAMQTRTNQFSSESGAIFKCNDFKLRKNLDYSKFTNRGPRKLYQV